MPNDKNKNVQDLYDAIHSVREICIELRIKMDAVIEKQNDHETRIRSVERWRWTHLASLPGIGSLFTHFFK